MKKPVLFGFIVVAVILSACTAKETRKPESYSGNSSSVEVYYFHLTARCTTCKTVEAEARKNIELLYADKIQSGLISFTSLNLEEEAGRTLAERLGVNSQSLLIISGNTKINITKEGFLYAVSQPAKFTEIMKSRIDPLLNN